MNSKPIKDINVTKVKPDVLHFLPFKPSHTRKKGFYVKRKYGPQEIEIEAKETLNTYDLITFAQIINEYLSNQNLAITGEVNGKPILQINFDLGKLCKIRGFENKKVVRKRLYESFRRLYSIDLTYHKIETTNHTKYIYDIEFDHENYNNISLATNKKFLEFCIKGLRWDYGRLMNYGKKGYATLLDTYLQGTKSKNPPKRIVWEYRYTYPQDTLFEALYLNETNMSHNDKHKELKKAFDDIHKIGGLPQYVYVKSQDKWCREDYLDKLKDRGY